MLTANIGDEENPVKSRIGNSDTKYFGGNFDGSGKTVYLGVGTGTTALKDFVAMFGVVGGNAIIKNIIVDGAVKCSSASNNKAGVASIVGAVLSNSGKVSATLINCTSNVNVISEAKAVGAGGLVGRILGNTVIDGCTNNGNVNAAKSNYAGGIIGYAQAATTITNCTNTGSISALTWAGGIVGLFNANTTFTLSGVTVRDCSLSVGYEKDGSTFSSLGGVFGRSSNASSTVKYMNWNVNNVTFLVGGNETTVGTTDFAEKKTANGIPGLMFGSCNGNLTEITE